MKHAKIIGILVLLALGIWLAWSETIGTSDETVLQSNKESENDHGENTHISRRKGVVYVKGMGGIHYDKVIKQADLKQWCNDFIPQEGMNLRTTIKVDVYLEGDKIVHMSKNRGLYKTEDMTAKAISEMERGQGSGATRTHRRENWLSISDAEILAQLWLKMKSTGWDLERMEAELTPIKMGFKGGKFDGLEFSGFFIRTCSGTNGVGFGAAHPKYSRKETIQRTWYAKAIRKINGKYSMKSGVIGGGITYLEAPLEVIEKWKPFYKEKERRQREERKERTPKRVEKR